MRTILVGALILAVGSGCLIREDVYLERLAYLQDSDGDGATDIEYGGDDCDDEDGDVFPAAVEVPYDSVDQNCDGADLVDVDEDGADGAEVGGPDCDDADPLVYPDADDACYDGVDSDCRGDDDDDCDQDGSPLGDDCDDSNAAIFPGATDDCYDGLDSDCGEDDDNDCDRDGQVAIAAGGPDCDDMDASVSSGGTEAWADMETDNDCDGRLDDPTRTVVETAGAPLTPPAGTSRFGRRMAWVESMAGGTGLLISAPEEASSAGAVYAVAADDVGGAFTIGAPWLRGAAGDQLGESLAYAETSVGGVALVGALAVAGGSGQVLLFEGTDVAPERELTPDDASAVIQGEPGAWFGADISVGDVDGDGVSDLLVAASGAGVGLYLGFEVQDRVQADADAFWGPQSGSFLSAELPGDVDGDGLVDVGLEQGILSGDRRGAAILGRSELVSGTFPADAPIQFIGEAELGPFVETAWGERALVVLRFQASVFLEPQAGAFDTLTDPDWELYRTVDEGGFTDSLWVEWLGALGPSLLFTAPRSPDGSESGECVVWSRGEWAAEVFSSDLPHALVGGSAGDRVCTSIGLVPDVTGDSAEELVIGGEGAGADTEGRAWLVPAP